MGVSAVADSRGDTGHGHGAVTEAPAYGIQTKKLVMWLFIAANAATFGAILFGYGYLRSVSPNWTHPFGSRRRSLTASS